MPSAFHNHLTHRRHCLAGLLDKESCSVCTDTQNIVQECLECCTIFGMVLWCFKLTLLGDFLRHLWSTQGTACLLQHPSPVLDMVYAVVAYVRHHYAKQSKHCISWCWGVLVGLWSPRTFSSSSAQLVWVLNPVLLISASSSQHPVFAESLQIQHLEKSRWRISHFHKGSAWDQSQCSVMSLVDTLCHFFSFFPRERESSKTEVFQWLSQAAVVSLSISSVFLFLLAAHTRTQ